MSKSSSKRRRFVPAFRGDGGSLRYRSMLVVALPVWVAVSFIAAQCVIIGSMWVLRRVGVLSASDLDGPVASTLFAVCVYAVTLLVVMGTPYVLARSITTKKRVGLQRLPSWTDIALALAGAVVYLFLSSVLLYVATTIFSGINPSEAQDTGFSNLVGQSQYLLAFATLIVLAPIAEETLFRGYLYGNLRRHAPVWLSILITSGLFGLAHMQWNVGIDTFALSIVLCSLREVTGSIWAGILLHMMKNALAFYILFIMHVGL